MADPDHSTICVLSLQDVESMREEDLQDIFRMQHVVVPDQFRQTLNFDEDGLKTLAELNKTVTLQGE
jgi:hypothetical protein